MRQSFMLYRFILSLFCARTIKRIIYLLPADVNQGLKYLCFELLGFSGSVSASLCASSNGYTSFDMV